MLKSIRGLSLDPTTKVAAIAYDNHYKVLATGYNRYASGYPQRTEDSRGVKLLLTVHAEVNLVASAARTGTSLKGALVAISEPPCPQCLSVLINTGVAGLTFPPFETCGHYDRWKDQFDLSKKILNKTRLPYKPLIME
jgi:deoxycytidylate deaminase